MQCPRCGAALNERRQVGVQVDVCTRCRGLWLDRGELEKLVATVHAAEWERSSLRAASLARESQAFPGRRKPSVWDRLRRMFELDR
jgi:Zn-finger nucleic acid-binding protein